MIGNLRPLKEDDLKMVLRWRNRDDVRKYMYNSHVISWEEHINWFAQVKDDPLKIYFIYENNSIPEGVIAFDAYSEIAKIASWAFYSGNPKKKGIGLYMEVAALSYAFDALKLQKLWCEVLSNNPSVLKFHKKFGFIEEGLFVNHHYSDDTYMDIYRLAIFKKTWQKNKAVFVKKVAAFSKVK